MDKAKESHSAFTKAENGKIYFNIKIWENDELDKFGNSMSVQLNPKKDAPEAEQKIYLGNCKPIEIKQSPVTANELDQVVNIDDLPF